MRGRQAVSQLLDMVQGSQSVAQYAVRFRILAAESGWGDPAFQAIFIRGLAPEVKDELALRDQSPSLNSAIDLAIRLYNRIRERNQERRAPPGATLPGPPASR